MKENKRSVGLYVVYAILILYTPLFLCLAEEYFFHSTKIEHMFTEMGLLNVLRAMATVLAYIPSLIYKLENYF